MDIQFMISYQVYFNLSISCACPYNQIQCIHGMYMDLFFVSKDLTFYWAYAWPYCISIICCTEETWNPLFNTMYQGRLDFNALWQIFQVSVDLLNIWSSTSVPSPWTVFISLNALISNSPISHLLSNRGDDYGVLKALMMICVDCILTKLEIVAPLDLVMQMYITGLVDLGYVWKRGLSLFDAAIWNAFPFNWHGWAGIQNYDFWKTWYSAECLVVNFRLPLFFPNGSPTEQKWVDPVNWHVIQMSHLCHFALLLSHLVFTSPDVHYWSLCCEGLLHLAQVS